MNTSYFVCLCRFYAILCLCLYSCFVCGLAAMAVCWRMGLVMFCMYVYLFSFTTFKGFPRRCAMCHAFLWLWAVLCADCSVGMVAARFGGKRL